MFGRLGLHGTYWIPAHVRGDREHGEVHKDYRVATGEGAASPDALAEWAPEGRCLPRRRRLGRLEIA